MKASGNTHRSAPIPHSTATAAEETTEGGGPTTDDGDERRRRKGRAAVRLPCGKGATCDSQVAMGSAMGVELPSMRQREYAMGGKPCDP